MERCSSTKGFPKVLLLAALGVPALTVSVRASSTLTVGRSNESDLTPTRVLYLGGGGSSTGVVNVSGGTLSTGGWLGLENNPPDGNITVNPVSVGSPDGGQLLQDPEGGTITVVVNGNPGVINVTVVDVNPAIVGNTLSNTITTVSSTESNTFLNPVELTGTSGGLVGKVPHIRIGSLDSTATLFQPVKVPPTAAPKKPAKPTAPHGTVVAGPLLPPTTVTKPPAVLAPPGATPPPIESGTSDAGVGEAGVGEAGVGEAGVGTTQIDSGPFVGSGGLVVTGGGTLVVSGPLVFNPGSEFQIGTGSGNVTYLGSGGTLNLSGGSLNLPGGVGGWLVGPLTLTNGALDFGSGGGIHVVVPEPGSVALLACGAFGLIARRRSRR